MRAACPSECSRHGYLGHPWSILAPCFCHGTHGAALSAAMHSSLTGLGDGGQVWAADRGDDDGRATFQGSGS